MDKQGEVLNPYFPLGMARIEVARQDLKPVTEPVLKVLENPLIWKQKPYVHEQAVLETYAGIVERQMKNEPPDLQDINNLSVVLQWIKTLKPEQFKAEPVKGRTISPCLLSSQTKNEIDMQLKEITNENFINNPNLSDRLVQIFRSHLGSMVYNGLLSLPVPELEKTLRTQK